MSIINDPKGITRRDIERDLDKTRKALRQAQTALLDSDPDVVVLAAERDAAEHERLAVLLRRANHRALLDRLRAYLGPIAEDNDPALVAEIRRTTEQLREMEREVDEATTRSLKAVRRYNEAVAVHDNRRARVRQLEQRINTLERELQRREPRASVLPRSWRDLIHTK